MNEDTVSGDMIGIALRQLGAVSVREIRSMMHLVNFELDDGFEVSYVFNITKGNQYYLQRMRPYAMPWGLFADTNQIIRFITQDIEKFRNACRSKNFKTFVATASKMNMLVGQLEELFLNCNVACKDLDQLDQQLDAVLDELTLLRGHTPPI